MRHATGYHQMCHSGIRQLTDIRNLFLDSLCKITGKQDQSIPWFNFLYNFVTDFLFYQTIKFLAFTSHDTYFSFT